MSDQTTRSGRAVRAPSHLIEEVDAAVIEETMAVGAGIGGGFEHMPELEPMKCDKAMKKDPESKSVQQEHERFE